MPDFNQKNWAKYLDNVQKQFLCCYPLNCITFEELPENINWEQQKQLIDVTYKAELNQQMPIKLSYQLMFFKNLIKHLEKSCNEIHDVIYETYCELQQQIAKSITKEYAFKHYLLNDNVCISLKESNAIIAHRTTGLCTWQASIALAEYLIQHPELINQKNVVELGSGIGLCGFVIHKLCQPKHLLLTDGSPKCIKLLQENMELNFPNHKITVRNNNEAIMLNKNIMECRILEWHDTHLMNELKCLKTDILLAADVVYDNTMFDGLTKTIDYIFNLNCVKMKMFLAATVRNELTLKEFLNKLETLNFNINELSNINLKDSRLHWDRSTPIKIFEIVKRL